MFDGSRVLSTYPEQMYLTILGDSWFRGDFNISYRFINRAGPPGLPIINSKAQVSSNSTLIMIIIIVSSILVMMILTILLCVYLRHRKQEQI